MYLPVEPVGQIRAAQVEAGRKRGKGQVLLQMQVDIVDDIADDHRIAGGGVPRHPVAILLQHLDHKGLLLLFGGDLSGSEQIIVIKGIEVKGVYLGPLGPVWVRTSGTWATKTYYDFDGHTGGTAPEGFQNVLTREQWEGVLDFVKAVDGRLLISVGNCVGNHKPDGSWDPAQARLLLDFSREYGVPVAAAEFMNEPNLLGMSGAPEGCTLEQLCRDQDAFFRMLKEDYPEVLLVGPSATCDPVGGMDETTSKWLESLGIAMTPDIMAGSTTTSGKPASARKVRPMRCTAFSASWHRASAPPLVWC